MSEFDSLTERGGVLGAMETMYQRSRIQEESLHYETLKHTGEYPIVGVNTFLSKEGSPTLVPGEVIRATQDEKQGQIDGLKDLHSAHEAETDAALKRVQEMAVNQDNLFAELMTAVKFCSLGQLTEAMFEVGGAYRRNM
jgi:methylmalonyl-CoA mutase